MRVCMARNDSPPGKVKPLGQRWMVAHSLRFMAALSSRPVHSPMSSSSRPSSGTTSRPSAPTMGAAVPRVRSSRRGVQPAATHGEPGAPSVAVGPLAGRRLGRGCDAGGDVVGLAASRVGQVQSGGAAGSSLPVVSVVPCRTSSTTVAAGARWRPVVRRAGPVPGVRSASGIVRPTYRQPVWRTRRPARPRRPWLGWRPTSRLAAPAPGGRVAEQVAVGRRALPGRGYWARPFPASAIRLPGS